MTRSGRLALVLGVAVATHAVGLLAIPDAVFTSVVGKPFGGAGMNELGHRPLPVPGMRAWGPSPDLIYSKCVFDLSEGPVRFRSEIPEDYWSMSVYAANSDLVAVLNDRELEDRKVDAVFALPGQPIPPGVRVIRMPGARGAALIRALVASPEKLPAIESLRRAGSCASW